jgi:AcrR family transcriptional regulator
MSDVIAAQRRPRGRPQVRSDEATRHLIAEAARGTFVASGYSAANMDCVAKTAAVSKKTLYRLFPTKAELFRASIADRIDSFILALDEERLAKLPPEAALGRILTEYGRLTLAQDTVAIQKLVVAESDRFPELAADFYRGAVIATQRMFARCLERLCREGAIEIDDLYETAGMLRGMMIFDPQRAATLGQAPPPSIDEITNRATRCARLFLDGCRKGKTGVRLSSQQCAGVVGASRSEPGSG